MILAFPINLRVKETKGDKSVHPAGLMRLIWFLLE